MKTAIQIVFAVFLCSCVFLILALLQSCDDSVTELEKLPPATQTGKNTFGCLVNGKSWVTETSVDAEAYYQSGVLSITAGLINSSFYQGISISLLESNLTETNYLLLNYPEGGRLTDFENNYQYFTSPDHIGNLTITHFDQINFIISGTFEFTAYSTDCIKTIAVTHGRFDLNYAP